MTMRLKQLAGIFALSTSSLAIFVSPQVMAQSESDAWGFTVGVGAGSQAKYPGSGDSKTSVFPVVGARYGRYFIGAAPGTGLPLGAGAYLIQNNNWHLGVGLGGQISKPREESDSPRLRGLGDIGTTTLGSVFGSYNDKWYQVRGSLVTDIGGKNQGTRFSMDLEGKYSLTDKLVLSAGPGFTWADGKYSQTFFGINAAQSAASGRALYNASSGINSIRFTVGADYSLSPAWGLGARITTATLRGDSAISPITEDKSQNSVGIFTTYRF